MEPTITKRLHISGLTPAISQQDLSQRLSVFGNVQSLDGLGLRDANGQPRRFAYATLEATPSKLSKCLNTLSGSTWKGTKLRIGEAKPDFRERIRRENEKAAEPPRKKLRWEYVPYHAVEAKDMEPITLEKAKRKASWVVTPLGRVYRPLRLKPLRPLPPQTATTTLSDVKGKGKEKQKVKKQRQRPDKRARIRKIDMVNYGSVYLKGRFLDVDVLPEVGGSSFGEDYVAPVEGSDEEGEDSDRTGDESETESEGEHENEEVETGREEDDDDVQPVQAAAVSETRTLIASQPTSVPTKPPPLPTVQRSTSPAVDFDFEKRHSLNVLASIFGTSAGNIDEDEEDDWIGEESLGSDVDEADLASDRLRVPSRPDDGDIDFEVVPRESGQKKRQERAHGDEALEEGADSRMVVDEGSGYIDEPVAETEAVEESLKSQQEPQQKAPTKLKDLFAPTETEGFSLLGHLNLDDDLELDEDLPFSTTHDEAEPPAIHEQPISAPTTAPSDRNQNQSNRHISKITLDPSKPLFFPLALLSSHPSFASSSFPTNPNAKNRPKDLYEDLEAKGWDWRTAGFYRTQSEDEIRQRWEEQKGELTAGWKKRWREAKRAGRRRGKSGGGDEGF